MRKQNICTTLSFISVLITAIGYCGDQSDGEENDQQQKPADIITDTPEVVGYFYRDENPMMAILTYDL